MVTTGAPTCTEVGLEYQSARARRWLVLVNWILKYAVGWVRSPENAREFVFDALRWM